MPAGDPLGRVFLPYLVNFKKKEVQLFNRNYEPIGEPRKLAEEPGYYQMKSVACSDGHLYGPMDGEYQERHDVWTAVLYDGALLDDADWFGYLHRLRSLFDWKLE